MHDLFMKLACCGKDEREGRIGRRRQSHGERQCLSRCLSLCLSVSASSSASVLVMCRVRVPVFTACLKWRED